ncbi:MAG: YraN family protein [Deltaproteobacteria bacterium]|jgi:putative endonuclease|nr:YraN family protein [Deltaproteobacteria bacterium]
MTKQTARQKLGGRGEEAAARLLVSKSYKILDRNWRHGRLELDLVCEDGDELVFVEVKTRTAGTLGDPADGMSLAKRRTLIRAARCWLAAHMAWERPCRFDVVCVTDDGQELRLEHLTNAFELSDALARGHAAWQPW